MLDSKIAFTLCENEDSVKSALTILKDASVVAFDCEGQDLGQEGGKLSLISLRVIQPLFSTTNFLFDAVKLTTMMLRPVFDLLESTDIQKIVFDGRMDYSCLFHDYGVSLANVLDIQLADIKSRATRGEGENAQMARLHKAVRPGELSANRQLYKMIHKLCGLMQCGEEHNIIAREFTNRSCVFTTPLFST
jgi:exonuclease 3'-5' domain-containing protein 1